MAQRLSYDAWIKKNKLTPTSDYDLHGAYLSGVEPDNRGHLPDTFKLPNHITYSDESIYSHAKGAPSPGKWIKAQGNRWVFMASPTNIKNAGGIQGLQKYFQENEPDTTLILPPQPTLPDVILGEEDE